MARIRERQHPLPGSKVDVDPDRLASTHPRPLSPLSRRELTRHCQPVPRPTTEQQVEPTSEADTDAASTPPARRGQWTNDIRTDCELLAATPDDADSFGIFYRRHILAMAEFMFRRVRDEEVAAELSAETFAAALEGIHRFDCSRGEPVQWLYGIGHNQLRRFWRRRRVSDRTRRRLGIPHETIDSESSALFARVEAATLTADLEDAMGMLSRPLRDAVSLRVLEELPYDQIGRRLGTSPATARVRVFRALAKLREVLE